MSKNSRSIRKKTTKSYTDKSGKFKKNNPGRPKGSKDKYTNLKKAFLEAFEKTGGTDGLVQWIKENKRNRAIFYQMLTKLFPMTVEHEGEVKHILEFDFGDNGE